MSVSCRIHFAAVAAAAVMLLASASLAHGVDTCKAKVERLTGLILVNATGVAGPLTWGESAGSQTNTFFNAGTCVTGDKAKECQIADPSTLAAKTPPAECMVYLNDTVAQCSTWIRSCSPGPRRDVALVLTDANGKIVGPIQDSSFGISVYLEQGGSTLKIPVLPDATGFQPSGSLVFLSSDCSGAPLQFPIVNAVNNVVVRATTGYLTPNTGTIQTANSILGISIGYTDQAFCDATYGPGNSTYAAPSGCCIVSTNPYPLGTSPTIDLSVFATPFAVHVR